MDNTDNRTDLPEGRAEQTRGAADETQTQAAAGKQAKTGGMTRRTLCLGIGGAAVMLGLGGLKLANSQAIIRPPGGQDEDRLIGACIRCEKCYEICPRDVIRPAHIEDGIVGVRTPRLDFSRSKAQLGSLAGWCDHCNDANGGTPRCAQVCPTGALTPSEGSTFDSMRLGTAVINRDWCLAWRLKGCTICLNACPLGAISFDGNNRPVVDERLCNGCGACEQACVSLESTSIGQDENNKHMTARAITVQQLER